MKNKSKSEKTTASQHQSGKQSVTAKGAPKTYFEIQVDKQRESKIAIAKFIVEKFLQGEGDSIILDAGTSLYPIAKEIAEKAVGFPERTHFTIMTHNYEAFQTLVRVPSSANMNIVLAGGRYDKDLNALFGPQTTNNYALFFPRVVLIGASGFVAQEGLFCHGNTEELSVKQVIFRKGCRDRIIVTDYAKLGTPDALKFGESKELKEGANRCVVVTNKPPKDADPKTLERYDKQVELLQNNCKVEVKELDV